MDKPELILKRNAHFFGTFKEFKNFLLQKIRKANLLNVMNSDNVYLHFFATNPRYSLELQLQIASIL